MRTLISMMVCLGVSACGRGGSGGGGESSGATGSASAAPASGACPALAVTVEGSPLSGLVHGQAVTMENAGYTTHMVNIYNHDKATCEEALSGRHNVQKDEIFVKAFHGAAPGVGIDAYTHLEGTLTLDKPPGAVGAPVEICVRAPITFTPNAGAFAGKKVTIVGRFSGAFCGVKKS
ncbi:MAG: hypothetical protein SFX73_24080 [Kofleriaceae bacterium]|nr:hypothetical protein [Kofleriaceae bacterium]